MPSCWITSQEEHKARKLQQLESYTSDTIDVGLWQSSQEVDTRLASHHSNADKVSAPKAQIRFRQFVLQQVPSDKNLFVFTAIYAQFMQQKQILHPCLLYQPTRAVLRGKKHC